MSNTQPDKSRLRPLQTSALAMAVGLFSPMAQADESPRAKPVSPSHMTTSDSSATLTARQQAIVPVAAFAASGDMPKLNAALNQGLDAGLSISDAREILVQVYAYAGFPRSLNALGELMKVTQARKQRGIQDDPGREPSRPIPKGDALLAAGTANQTKLSGARVEGALFEFAPTANEYLRSHLFGDIFERDNLDWQSRELATVGMLSAMSGVQPQLLAHVRISMNVGLSEGQMHQVADVLAERVDADSATRAREALAQHLAVLSGKKP
ncbi:4-carboxymuconolactone decarboxylase [Bordetella ansorpii]|uniref:4-carboxymuconolactone decarboxylase n=1 Tax=Bordetella ansorpii TaxID=288768 RepID=A0A157NUB7_9BORD|nr:4-carboxymuconolactone decarboxylase [Bordetella ansorpii]